jgi:hypothetical protein
MKIKILNWLKYDRNFDSGVRLYHEFGSNMMLKRTFNHTGATDYNIQLLFDELIRLADIPADELRHILSTPVSVYQKETIVEQEIPVEAPPPPVVEVTNLEELKTNLPEDARKAFRLRDEFPFLKEMDCPNELKILVHDMLCSFDNYKLAHEALFTAENEEELLQFSKATVESYLENRLIWDELNYFKEHQKVLAVHPIFEEMREVNLIREMKIIDLAKKKKNLLSNISQVKIAIAKGDKPEKNLERQIRLESKQRLLAIVEAMLLKAE